MKYLLRIILILVVLLLMGGVAIWLLARQAPSWYLPPDVNDEKVQALADRVEYRLVEEAQRVRPTGNQWTLRVRDKHINTWLAARLSEWFAYHEDIEWPAALGLLQVHTEVDHVNLALPIQVDSHQSVIVLRLRPAMHDGKLQIILDRIDIGRLPIPGEPVFSLISKLEKYVPEVANNDSLQSFADYLSGEKIIDPVFNLEDDRSVTLVDLQLHNGAIDLTLITNVQTSNSSN